MSDYKTSKYDDEYRKTVEGPAGIGDKFSIRAIEMKEIVNDRGEQAKRTTKNTKMVAPNAVKRDLLSTELNEGVVIKATNGDKPKTQGVER